MTTKKIKTLVLSGGGAKGIAYAGVLKKIDEIRRFNTYNNKYNIIIDIDEILGVSIGSIIGFLYIIGYNGVELTNEIYNMKTKKMQKLKIINLLNDWGFDSGESMIEWIEQLCIKKNLSKWITFNELYEITKINFRVGVTNLNKYEFEIFDKYTHPDVSVLRILRLSMNIPLIFTKQEFLGEYYVDGGLINNYPLIIYNNDLDHVIGVKLNSSGQEENDIKIETFEDYIKHTIYCYLINGERKSLLDKNHVDKTIFIDTGLKNPVQSKFKNRDKSRLINIGYKSADEYFKRWIKKIKID